MAVGRRNSPGHLQALLMQHHIITRVSEYGRGNVIELRPPLVMTMDEAVTTVTKIGCAVFGPLSRVIGRSSRILSRPVLYRLVQGHTGPPSRSGRRGIAP